MSLDHVPRDKGLWEKLLMGEGRALKIVDVKGYLLPRAENPLRFQWRQGIPSSDPFVEMGVLRIVTDEGVDGFAETSCGPIAMDIIHWRFKEMLKEEDPLLKE